ncbi:MAG: TetR/AcrR family transcriptional regulator [Clostridia bacterium]|nr:TetR/AcrR family transcriptional regulator [Clostridia bacterium]
MRTVKPAQERKNEILDAASALFSQKGFDATSVNDILERVGIAKGTFYYYFQSKEEVMDALIDRVSAHMLAAAREIAADGTLGVHEKIFRVVMALNMRGGADEALLQHIHQPQNALMHEKSLRTLITGVTPILAAVVEDGAKQGLFDTAYPYEAVEMIIIYVQIAFDEGILPHSPQAQAARIPAFIAHIERLLGAKAGSFAYVTQLFDEDRN